MPKRLIASIRKKLALQKLFKHDMKIHNDCSQGHFCDNYSGYNNTDPIRFKNETYKDTGVLGILIGFWDLGRFYPLSGT